MEPYTGGGLATASEHQAHVPHYEVMCVARHMEDGSAAKASTHMPNTKHHMSMPGKEL